MSEFTANKNMARQHSCRAMFLFSFAKTSFLSLVRCFPRFDPLVQHGEKCGSHTVDGSAVKFHKLLDVIVDGSYIAL